MCVWIALLLCDAVITSELNCCIVKILQLLSNFKCAVRSFAVNSQVNSPDCVSEP